MTIVSDLDGCIVSFESGWAPLLAKIAGENKLPKDFTPQEWDWDVAAYGRDVVSKAWDHVRASSTFWTKLDPIVDDPTALGRRLEKLHREHNLIFMTSRVGVGVQRQSSEWIYKHLGIAYPTVLVVDRYQDKIPLLMNLNADWFVDDKLETVELFYNECYKTRRPIRNYFLIDQPYNRTGRTVKGMRVAANLTEALKEAGL